MQLISGSGSCKPPRQLVMLGKSSVKCRLVVAKRAFLSDFLEVSGLAPRKGWFVSAKLARVSQDLGIVF